MVIDGTGRRWSLESWCTADLVCTLRWVGPGLVCLTADELATRGPVTVLYDPAQDCPTARHTYGV